MEGLSREEVADLVGYLRHKFDREAQGWLAAGRAFIERSRKALEDLGKCSSRPGGVSYTWRLYQVIFRLRSSLHIGCGKVGNLQRTRLEGRPCSTMGTIIQFCQILRILQDYQGFAARRKAIQRIGLFMFVVTA